MSDKPKAVRRVPLFKKLDGAEAVMWREGGRLVIEPVRKGGLLDLLAGLPPLPDEFPDVDDTLQPLDDVEI